MISVPRLLPWRRYAALLCLVVAGVGCGASRNIMPANTANPDRFLYDRGLQSLQDRKWLNAREYFRQVVDNYPQSPLRPDAKLGIGDAYLGEKGGESLVLAANEYREFLTFYPQNPRADYAQFKLAMCHHAQMRAPDRDQTETRDALTEFQAFFARFSSTSKLTPEVRQRFREARDRLSEHSFRVGQHYYRVGWYPGAMDRFREVLKEDPEYSGRDRIYFFLAESLFKSGPNRMAEALPYYQRLLDEFPMSEYRDEATARLAEASAIQNKPTQTK